MPERFREPHSHPRWWWVNDFVPSCFECAHFDGMVKGEAQVCSFPGWHTKRDYSLRETRRIKHHTPGITA